MRIALAAHGRFHAFDYARELAAQGHTVGLFTNYPAAYVRRWGVPGYAVRAFPSHGAASRLAHAAGPGIDRLLEPALHRWFGRAAARTFARGDWDVICCWSGIGEETFATRHTSGLRLCHRSSAHIRVQDALLQQEARRAHAGTERPSPWMIAREEREYATADRILVPSSFARDTFLAQGVAAERLLMVPLGVDVEAFRPSADVIEARVARICSGAPLRVGLVGTVSVQKGLVDVIAIARALGGHFTFSWTGATAADAAAMLPQLAEHVRLERPRPQAALPHTYAELDVFLFPTIQDGFGMVVSQALASGLPVLASTHSCAPDVVRDGVTGWVVPPCVPDTIIERLRWCDSNRDTLAAMCRAIYSGLRPMTWADSAARMAALCS